MIKKSLVIVLLGIGHLASAADACHPEVNNAQANYLCGSHELF